MLHGALPALLLTFAWGAPARAAEVPQPKQAVALAFPGAEIVRVTFTLAPGEVAAVQKRARARLGSRIVSAWSAWRGDTLAGAAFFDQRIVRTMPATLMVAVQSDTTLARVEIIAFHEPPDYRPPMRWLGLFGGRRLDDRLWPHRDVRNLAGATLSTRAITESARVGLALYAQLAPRLTRDPQPRAR